MICHALGIPRAARTAPRKANGSANSVCSILIISSVVRMFVEREGISDQNSRFQIQNSKAGLETRTENKLKTQTSSSNLEPQPRTSNLNLESQPRTSTLNLEP